MLIDELPEGCQLLLIWLAERPKYRDSAYAHELPDSCSEAVLRKLARHELVTLTRRVERPHPELGVYAVPWFECSAREAWESRTDQQYSALIRLTEPQGWEAVDDIRARRPKARKQGRPVRSDPKLDKDLAVAWATGKYATHEALGREFGISKADAKHALDRHRHRKRS